MERKTGSEAMIVEVDELESATEEQEEEADEVPDKVSESADPELSPIESSSSAELVSERMDEDDCKPSSEATAKVWLTFGRTSGTATEVAALSVYRRIGPVEKADETTRRDALRRCRYCEEGGQESF
jgi:hypothetical protein